MENENLPHNYKSLKNNYDNTVINDSDNEDTLFDETEHFVYETPKFDYDSDFTNEINVDADNELDQNQNYDFYDSDKDETSEMMFTELNSK
ncbi:Hypothetical protein KVN_LOCUS201 [uncultured virus]|nr:Hypothetical protein KVN_LOCUS201 [uncultured virus]